MQIGAFSSCVEILPRAPTACAGSAGQALPRGSSPGPPQPTDAQRDKVETGTGTIYPVLAVLRQRYHLERGRPSH